MVSLLKLWSLSLLLVAVSYVAQGQGLDPQTAKHAAMGDAAAEVQMGKAYQRGDGVEKNSELAMSWFRKAANQGDARGELSLGLGLLYGWGQQKDIREGISLLNQAGEKGVAEANFILGQLYEDGGLRTANSTDGKVEDMVPKNDVFASKYYKIAALQSLPIAQNHLGRMYLEGRGVVKNYADAYYWLSLGDAGGSHSITDGTDDRDLAAAHLSATVVAKLQIQATNWFEKHPPINPFQ